MWRDFEDRLRQLEVEVFGPAIVDWGLIWELLRDMEMMDCMTEERFIELYGTREEFVDWKRRGIE